MTYNIAVGMDNSTLNKLISEVYTSIYPNIFKSTINIMYVHMYGHECVYVHVRTWNPLLSSLPMSLSFSAALILSTDSRRIFLTATLPSCIRIEKMV